ncbi:diacylglycerol kinase family protein [Novosphingobium sp.]|uniref:diacylglycerol/lipid kinase family protein n=1 Tax=Novosphingobium sp. TaxID=1874826 RepID=UPI00286D9999|nr:diacylglycerol kinase family protein [Novosphingobium sp.]
MHRQVLPVVINCEGGTAAGLGDTLPDAIHDAFAPTGQAIDLKLVKAKDLDQAIAATSAPVVAVGGGDGTLASAAARLAGEGRCLAVLPLGTRNHFARDIGLDGTLEQAAQVAAHGRCDAVDVGYAGERLFLNNASLGLYARMVEDRDRRNLPKWLATLPAALHVLVRPGTRRLDLDVDGTRRRVKTPLLFIGNNLYSLEKGRIGQRETLQDGELSLFAVAQRGGPGLLLAAWRIMRGKVDRRADFAAIESAREVVAYRHGTHHLALDGEVIELEFPLTFRIAPGGLKVMLPAIA